MALDTETGHMQLRNCVVAISIFESSLTLKYPKIIIN
jgi:hypothetical protein